MVGQFIDVGYMLKCIPSIAAYLPVTLWLAIASMAFGLVLGLAAALARIYRTPVLRQISLVYVSFIRGTPVLVQLYLVYYGLPKLLDMASARWAFLASFSINQIPPEAFAVLAFSLNMGGYLAETLRAAIEAVDRGQFEAADSIGMSRSSTLRLVVLPQAALIALPNLGNSLISMVKDTSLAFMIMVVEVMGQAKIIGARGLRIFEVYIGVSLIYWATCIVLEQVFRVLEKRLGVYERRSVE